MISRGLRARIIFLLRQNGTKRQVSTAGVIIAQNKEKAKKSVVPSIEARIRHIKPDVLYYMEPGEVTGHAHGHPLR